MSYKEYGNMELKIPEEPTEIKKLIQLVRDRLSSDDRNSNINYDSLAVWSCNSLPKFLWKQWKNDLKQRGITWQKFLRILKLHTQDMIGWALKSTITWSELIIKIEKSIDYYSTLFDLGMQ